MKILLVEDDLSLINGISLAIEKQGYELDTARTVSETKSMREMQYVNFC
jgi:DNA-binding response OmpR family regulator